ncbi:hypothetical protein A6E00_08220 [Vibrio diabolicus]|uniref:helix-turn-helix domain-containing protein n=1 Tax=Vibrio diabolicus subgroup TaxID=2315253 RepID=UPI00080F3B11|nr:MULTISPECIES: helix-turn-helix transcriptional regulator [Vibrio diabolicus subgroup]OCH70518.1 hypothetical protein A6E00_08220 [Vibrio diabolicus]
MSERYPNYFSTVTPTTKDAFKNKACSLPLSHPNFKRPLASEVKELRKILGFSQADLGRLAGKRVTSKGCSHVRKWETDESKSEHRGIDLGVWRMMLYCADICSIEDDLNFIENIKA